MQLNEAQQAAVDHGLTPLFVLAGAGTGKTAVLIARIASLLQRGLFLPQAILAVTFTNKAARSLQQRLQRQIGDAAFQCTVGTFHRISGQILRQDGHFLGLHRDYVIYDTADQVQLIKACMQQQGLDPKVISPKLVLQHIESWKNQGVVPAMLTPQQVPYTHRTSLALYAAYQASCRAGNGVDFNDLLLCVVQLFQQFPQVLQHWQKRWRCIVVDEYQDTNTLQYRFLKALATQDHSLTVVGDDDQAIYGWRGAKIEHILRFEQDFPKASLIRLERSYRCSEPILHAANEVIRHNQMRKGKTLYSNGQAGEAVVLTTYATERDEAMGTVASIQRRQQAGLPLGEMAVLLRTNAQARPIEEALQRAGLPYVVVGGMRFYDRKEIKDMLALLRSVYQPHSDVDLLRVIGLFGQGIGERTVGLLRQEGMKAQQSLWTTLQQPLQETVFPKRAVTVLQRFVHWFEQLLAGVQSLDLVTLFEQCLAYTGYKQRLLDADGQDQGDRAEHLQSFQRSLQDYALLQEQPTLQHFLEDVALATDVADMSIDPSQSPLVLLTLHAAKGLEFSAVWLVGLEEGLLPHERSLQQAASIEEERRLCYVGITRAKQFLSLSWVRVRSSYGMPQVTQPSRFLQELPADCIRQEQAPWGGTAGLASEDSSFGALSMGRETATWRHPGQGRTRWDGSPSQVPADALSTAQPTSAVGTQVQHATFGLGQVVGQQGTGKEMIYTIDFAQHGRKTVVARFVVQIDPFNGEPLKRR